MSTTTTPPPAAASRRVRILAGLRGRVRRGVWTEGGGRLLLLALAWTLASLVLDHTLRLEWGYRAVLLGLGLGAALATLRNHLLDPLRVALPDAELALAVERVEPRAAQALISAVEFAAADPDRAGGESRALMEAVVRDVETALPGLGYRRAVDAGRVFRFGLAAAGCVAVLGAWAALFPDTAGLWAQRNLLLSAREWPRRTQLEFVDAGAALRVPQGDEVTVRVRARGVVPEQVFLRYELDDGASGTEAMTLTGEGDFVAQLPPLPSEGVLQAHGGDGLTPELRIVLVPRPRIDQLALTAHVPAYVQRPPEAIPLGDAEVRVLRGTRIAVQGKATKVLREASLVPAEGARVALALAGDGAAFAGEFVPSESGAYALEVVDQDRLANAPQPRFVLRVVDDLAPKAAFLPRGVGARITPIARIPGTLRATDDFGLAAVGAEARAGGDATTPLPADAPWLPLALPGLDTVGPGTEEFITETVFDLMGSSLGELKPEQTLALRLKALDRREPEPQVGLSEPVVFRIVTKDKLLEELARRQAEQRRELQLILADLGAAKADLEAIPAPAAADPKAAANADRLQALARGQRTLGARVKAVGDAYSGILEEMRNNRLFEETVLRRLETGIVAPLRRVAQEEFPLGADQIAAFATGGQEEGRGVALATLEAAARVLRQVLRQMEQLESMAAVLESLREVLRLEENVADDLERLRRQVGTDIFGPDPGPAATRPKDK